MTVKKIVKAQIYRRLSWNPVHTHVACQHANGARHGGTVPDHIEK